jgi:hypothetical protein
MKTTGYLAAAFFGLATLGQTGAQAGMVNAGFETGDLTGWTVTVPDPYNPHEPYNNAHAIVYTHGQVSDLAWAGDRFVSIFPENADEAWISLSQTFFMSKGETLNGAVDFIPSMNSWHIIDWARVTIGDVVLYATVDDVIATFKSGWQPYSFTAPSDGDYTFTATMWRGNSSYYNESALRLDAIEPEPSASAVPEASTWAMMLIGFAGLGYAAYRRARGSHGALAA